MNDISMGFKHTMLQRLQNYEVYPSKSTASSNSSESGEEQTPQPAHVTDFSISRILGDEAHNKSVNQVKTPAISVKSNLSAPITPTLFATDILDLSKTSPAVAPESPIEVARQPAYPTPTYQGFHSDFLAAAATANATKFYAQFFPHMFAPYALPNFSVTPPTPYQKQRYFAPYIINSTSTHPTQPIQSVNLRLPTLTNPPNIPLSPPSSRNVCSRVSCVDCLELYKQHPLYKSTVPSVPSSPASSTSSVCHSSYSANYLKTKSPAELLLKSSTIALTTVANFNLTSKATKLHASPLSTALNAEEISYKCCICDKVFGCSQTLQVSVVICAKFFYEMCTRYPWKHSLCFPNWLAAFDTCSSTKVHNFFRPQWTLPSST